MGDLQMGMAQYEVAGTAIQREAVRTLADGDVTSMVAGPYTA